VADHAPRPLTSGNDAPDAAEQLRSGIWYVLPVVVGALLPLVRLPIVTRYVGSEDYGAWALATAYGAFVTSVASFGLAVAYDRNFFQQKSREAGGSLLFSVTAFVAVMCLAGGVATHVWQEPIAAFLTGRPDDGRLVVWTYWGAAIVAVKACFLVFLRNSGDAKSYVRYTLDDTVGGTVLSVVLIVAGGFGVLGLPMGTVGAGLVVLLLVLRRVSHEVPIAFSRAQLGSALQLGVPLLPRVFLRVVSANVDKYVVGVLSSVGTVGVYAVGQRIGYAVFTLMTAIENIYMPLVYRRMFAAGSDAADDLGRLLTPYAYLSVGIALAVAALAPEMVTVLAAPEYAGAIPIAALFAVHYGLMFFGKIPQLTFAGRTGVISILAILATIINVLLAVIFVPRWGALGAVAAVLLGGILADGVHFVVSQRTYRIEWEYRRLAAMYALLGAMGGTVVMLALSPLPSVAGWGLRGAVLAAYVALGAYLGVVTRANGEFVLGMVRRRIGARA
jgi:O-antigen/teichoic acid export membrane protein